MSVLSASLLPRSVPARRKPRKAQGTAAVCDYHLGPYHHARLRAASAHCCFVAVEFCAVARAHAWPKVEQAAGYKKITLFEDADVDAMGATEVRRHAFQALTHLDPSVVVVPGWSGRAALTTLQWALRAGRPAVLMSDSTQHDSRRYALSEAIKRRIVRLYSAALVAGGPQRAYVRSLGLTDDAIFEGYDVVDNGYFAESATRVRDGAAVLRPAHRLPTHFFLASSRFVEKKNLSRLLDAYARYREQAGASRWSLVLLGDGELRAKIVSQIARLQLVNDVHLPGFRQYDELPVYYGLAGAFVHASTSEQWGLVVNEAAASGLPVLVSERCGCAADLVQDGVNGYTFDPYDVERLARLMTRVAGMTDGERTGMGNESRRIIADWGLDRFSDGLKNAVMFALRQSPRRKGWLDSLILEALIRRSWPDRDRPAAGSAGSDLRR